MSRKNATPEEVRKTIDAVKSRVRTADQKRAAAEQRAARNAEQKKTRGPVKRKARHVEPQLIMPQMTVHPVLLEVLEIARFQRHVSRSTLIRDILTGWATTCIDTRQAIYRETLGVHVRLPALLERWPGYLESLGFKHLMDEEIPPDAVLEERMQPAVDEPVVVNVLPPDVETAAPVVQPFQGLPVGAGGSFRPNEVEPLSPEEQELLAQYGGGGVRTFDAAAHRATAVQPGVGNGAQQAGYVKRA